MLLVIKTERLSSKKPTNEGVKLQSVFHCEIKLFPHFFALLTHTFFFISVVNGVGHLKKKCNVRFYLVLKRPNTDTVRSQ